MEAQVTPRCPDCEGTQWMRAVEVVTYTVRTGFWGWILGKFASVPMGINAVCADPRCGCVVRISPDGARRLRMKPAEAQPAKPQAPSEPETKPQMALNRTPGMEWMRGER